MTQEIPRGDDPAQITDLHVGIQNAFKKLDAALSHQNTFTHQFFIKDDIIREKIKLLEEENSYLRSFTISCRDDLTLLSSRFLSFHKIYSNWRYKYDLMKNENEKMHHILKSMKYQAIKQKKQNLQQQLQKSPTEISQDTQEHYLDFVNQLKLEKFANIYEELQSFLKSPFKNSMPLQLHKMLTSLLKKYSDTKEISCQQLIRSFTTFYNQMNTQRASQSFLSFPQLGMKKHQAGQKTEESIDIQQNHNASLDMKSKFWNSCQMSPEKKPATDLDKLKQIIQDTKIFESAKPFVDKVQQLWDHVKKKEARKIDQPTLRYKTESTETDFIPIQFNFLTPQKPLISVQGRHFRSISLKCQDQL